jgi:hypothetical protein
VGQLNVLGEEKANIPLENGTFDGMENKGIGLSIQRIATCPYE